MSRKRSRHRPAARTMEQAVQDYLADLMRQHRRPKTLEWHEMALGSLQRYLLTEHHCVLVHHLTPAQMEGWLAFLQEHPTATGSRRTPSTVQSYARSARAFCQWLVQQKELPATPFAHLSLPQAANRVPRLLSPAAWERLLWACEHPKNAGKRAERARARNRALLWVLFDTGMWATEVCALRLCDVNREQGVLSVRGKGSQVRWLTLGQEGQHHLRIYLDDYRLAATSRELASASEQPLFLSEAGRPLTKSGVTRLFGRLRKRVGTTGEDVTASLLRQGFALRYLQTGGDPCTLPDLLGQQDCASLISLLNQNQEGCENDIQKPYPEAHRQRIS
ncbi:MAG: tyrosine-type recombinase/integrase [Ktedonobacteraceae bacterium]|nr:tyrosine-type recombinase/integrase [Ktedonobacteraceae bacterium]